MVYVIKLRTQLVGFDDALRYYRGVAKRLKPQAVPNLMTKDMASLLRARVKSNIPINRWGEKGKHNTKTKLVQLLNPVRKVKGGHVVSFKRSGEYPDLPETVEYGTKGAYWQGPPGKGKKNPMFLTRMHPKNKPTNFWKNSWDQFRENDMEKELSKGMRKIVGR